MWLYKVTLKSRFEKWQEGKNDWVFYNIKQFA
jgi:hypothetical protein